MVGGTKREKDAERRMGLENGYIGSEEGTARWTFP